LQDALAPVIRFLVLFALFTAAGTWFLTSTRPAESDRGNSEPQTTVAQPTLTPQQLNPEDNVIESSAVLPTATGPLGTKAPRTGWRNRNGKQTPRQNPQSAVGPTTSASRIAGLDSDLLSEGATNGPSDEFYENESASPPAIARLPGYILASPAKQAHHDRDESSLH
jgi:hypothetical protein